MDNLSIYRAALIKAINNGYDFSKEEPPHTNSLRFIDALFKDDDAARMFVTQGYLYFSDIFRHEFAKAFWGEERTSCNCDTANIGEHCAECLVEYKWQYHLQQMVLEEEPLQYLKKFL